jgi:hypothetical protein
VAEGQQSDTEQQREQARLNVCRDYPQRGKKGACTLPWRSNHKISGSR